MKHLHRLLLAVVFAVPGAAAAAYPDKPINLIVAYSPGGGTDLIARAIQPYLEKYIGGGAKIIIVHRPGAGGEIGFAAIANAAPDGYTIGFVNTPPLITVPIERTAQFGGPQRFELLGNVIDDPCNFAVHADSELRDLKGLAAYAKANPGKVTVGSTGVGSDDHLLMLMFERAAGVKMTHVPFKGASDVRTALLSQNDHRRRDQHRRGGAVDQGRRADAQHRPVLRRAHHGCARPADRARAGLRHRALVAARHGRAEGPAARGARAPGEGGRRRGRRRRVPGQGDQRVRAAAFPHAGAVRAGDKEAEVGFRQLWKELPWGEK